VLSSSLASRSLVLFCFHYVLGVLLSRSRASDVFVSAFAIGTDGFAVGGFGRIIRVLTRIMKRTLAFQRDKRKSLSCHRTTFIHYLSSFASPALVHIIVS